MTLRVPMTAPFQAARCMTSGEIVWLVVAPDITDARV